jgi:hypothetical protein
MNPIRFPQSRASCAPRPRHPERSLTASDASRHTESNHPMPAESATAESRSFRIVVRFFDEHAGECIPVSRRAATAEYSPRRKLRQTSAAYPGPEAAQEPTAGQSRP